MQSFKPFQVGNYHITSIIAQGGMGCVYRAQQRGASSFNRLVAMKQVLPQFVNNPKIRQRFELEARVCSQFNHPNIVQVYDFVQHEGSYYLVMELIRGISLQLVTRALFQNKLECNVEFALYVLCEVLKGLDYAHNSKDDEGKKLGIIHRDISPQNIMLSYSGGVKIVDFGLAQVAMGNDFSIAGVKGKFSYMSPEQAEGDALGPPTDIYSSGILLHELLSGRKLFDAPNEVQLLKLVQQPIIAPPTQFNSEVSEKLSAITLRALACQQEKRYPTADALYTDLHLCLVERYPNYGAKDIAAMVTQLQPEDLNNSAPKINPAPFPPSNSAKIPSLPRDRVQTVMPRSPITLPEIEAAPETHRSNFTQFLLIMVFFGLPFFFRQEIKSIAVKWRSASSKVETELPAFPKTALIPPSTSSEKLNEDELLLKHSRHTLKAPDRKIATTLQGPQILLSLGPLSRAGAVRLECTDHMGSGFLAEGCTLSPATPRCPVIPLQGTPPFRIALKVSRLNSEEPEVVLSRPSCEGPHLKGKLSANDTACEFITSAGLDIPLVLLTK